MIFIVCHVGHTTCVVCNMSYASDPYFITPGTNQAKIMLDDGFVKSNVTDIIFVRCDKEREVDTIEVMMS